MKTYHISLYAPQKNDDGYIVNRKTESYIERTTAFDAVKSFMAEHFPSCIFYSLKKESVSGTWSASTTASGLRIWIREL